MAVRPAGEAAEPQEGVATPALLSSEQGRESKSSGATLLMDPVNGDPETVVLQHYLIKIVCPAGLPFRPTPAARVPFQ